MYQLMNLGTWIWGNIRRRSRDVLKAFFTFVGRHIPGQLPHRIRHEVFSSALVVATWIFTLLGLGLLAFPFYCHNGLPSLFKDLEATFSFTAWEL